MRRTACAAILFSCVFCAVSPAGEINYQEGVVYATRGDLKLMLDIASPRSGEMRPALLFIHGGAWMGGNRKAHRWLIKKAAQRGFVAATIDYRLTPVAPWPAQIEDVKDAFLYLVRNARKLGIDPERIGAIGDSAGGHLALMLGLTPPLVKDGPRVRCVVNFYGPTDLRPLAEKKEAQKILETLAGGPLKEKQQVLKDASPVVYVDRTDPAVLTFHGTADPIVPFSQAELLHAALQKAGVPNRLAAVEGGIHGFPGKMPQILEQVWAFFKAYLMPTELPLLAADDFEQGAARWEPTDRNAWRIKKRKGDAFYSLFKRHSSYKPPYRSPYNISLLKDVSAGDFVMEVDLRSTIKPYGHQDLCLFFDYQNPAHFYYVHIGRRADAHANSIFIVNKAPRVSIAAKRTKGTDWSKGWHRARIVRRVADGTIEVYFDDMEKPIMSASDKHFLWGRVGVGSFDDTGEFDAFRLWGLKAQK